MIKIKILAPNQGSRKEDYNGKIWRIYFEDPEFDESKSAYIKEMDLLFKYKIDVKNKDNVRSYLKDWAEKYIKDKKFEDIENEFSVSL